MKNISFLFSAVFLLFVFSIIFIFNTALKWIAVYFIMSLFTFLIYAWDKKAAQNGNWRIKESTLHLLSFIGGLLILLRGEFVLILLISFLKMV